MSTPDIGIHLQEIRMLDHSYAASVNGLTPPLAFDFNLTLTTSLDADRQLVSNTVAVTIQDSTSKTTIGTLSCACIFRLDRYDKAFRTDKSGRSSIIPEVAEVLHSISVSTTRGIMFSEWKGTVLHHAILPVIDPRKMEASPS